MADVASKVSMKVLTVLVGIPVGIASRKLVQKLWLAARPGDPPRNPSDPNVSWADAVGWAALSGIGAAVAQLVASRSAGKLVRTVAPAKPAGQTVETEAVAS